MRVLVIAGSGRGVGKTAVGCALIAAMPEFRWVAVKVTPHPHQLSDGIEEEADRASGKDTGRYLAAGAERAFLIALPGPDGGISGLLTEVLRRSPGAEAMVVESGRAAEIAGEWVLRLAVLAGPEREWKPALHLDRADALVLAGSAPDAAMRLRAFEKPRFQLPLGQWSSAELVQFVRGDGAGSDQSLAVDDKS